MMAACSRSGGRVWYRGSFVADDATPQAERRQSDAERRRILKRRLLRANSPFEGSKKLFRESC